MITPIEIQSKSFKSGGLGYDKKDVDGFFREVLRNYEQLYRENMELNDKVAVLTEGIQYYKTIEKTLQKALVLAEKTAEDTKSAALEKAKAIEKEANTRSQLIVADAKNELEHIHNQTIQLIQQYEKYKQQFKHLAQAQMELLESECFNINVARLDAFIDTKQVNLTRDAGSQDQQGKQEGQRHINQRYTNQRYTSQKQAGQNQTEQRKIDQRQAGQKHTEQRQIDQRQSGQNQIEQRQIDQRQVDQNQTEHRQAEQNQTEQRKIKQRQMGQRQVPNRQSFQKHEKQYVKEEEYHMDMEPSFLDTLEQVATTKEDMDSSYGNVNHYIMDDEEDYPYEGNEVEHQDEFSFINLVDEED